MSNLLSLWKEHPVFLRETIFLSLISLAFAAGFFFFLFRRKMKLAQIYFLSMMILGSLYSFVLMPYLRPWAVGCFSSRLLHSCGINHIFIKNAGFGKAA